jgi:hypothetical protein
LGGGGGKRRRPQCALEEHGDRRAFAAARLSRRHYVSHTQYEFGSVVRFVEDTFGLPRLGSVRDGYSDARANSVIDSFDFTQPLPDDK